MTDELILSEALGLLKSLIRIPSISREEESAADFLQKYIEAYGMETGRKGNNVWCLSPGFNVEKPTILLNSHIDTIKPVSGWKKEPYTPFEEDDKIFGLGSNDAGASLVSLLQAFFLLTKKEQSYNLIYLASCEEEISGEGGIECALEKLPPIDFAIVGEPTQMNPAIAEKGLMVVDVTSEGVAWHAARNGGVNAIYKSLKDIEWVKDYKFEKTSPLLGEVLMNVTQINAGTQHNVIPDKCIFTIDIRSNELYTNEELFSIISKEITGKPVARSFRLNSTNTNPEHPFIKKATELGKVAFGSPTLSDQALMKFPSVKIGPGSSDRSHSADEYIIKDEIKTAIEEYYMLLNGFTL